MKTRLLCALLASVLALPAWAGPRDDARRLVDAHQYPAALAIFNELVQANPDDIDLLIETARVDAWDDRHEPAIALYRRVMELAPTRAADVRLALAWQLLWAGQAAEALVQFDARLSAQPTDTEALHGKAEALVALNKLDEALLTYRQILTLAPTDTKVQLQEAQVLLRQGSNQDALHAYQRILAQRPNDADALAGLGQVRDGARRLVDAHQYPAALEIFNRFLDSSPDDVDLLIETARVNAWADRHDAAVVLYERVMKRDPARSADVRLALAWQLLWANRPAEALPQFDAQVSVQPSDAEAMHGRAEALAALNRLDEALLAYRKILTLAPTDSKAQLQEAQILLWQDQDQAALEAYQRFLAQHPYDRTALAGLARAQDDLGLNQQAARGFKALVKDDPGLKLDYGQALRWAGMDEEALDQLDGLDSDDAAKLRGLIERDLRSHLSFNAEFSTDSDQLDITAATVQANFHSTPGRNMELGIRQAWLDQNGSSLNGQTYWLGYGWRSGGVDSSYGLLWPSLYLGLRDYDGWQTASWKAHAKWLPVDRWRWDFEAGNDIVENIASIQNHVRFDYLSGGFDFRPAPLWLLNLGTVAGRFDDGNQRKKLTGRIEYRVSSAPRLTVGVEGMGFNDSNPPSPGRGYYSPESYREIKLAGRVEGQTHGWDLSARAALGELWEQPAASSTLYLVETSATRPTKWGDVRFYAGRSDSASLTSGGGGYWRSYVGATVNMLY